MVRVLSLFTLVFMALPSANAQWFQPGLGQANYCPHPQGIAPNLFNPEDRLDRVKSLRRKAERGANLYSKRIAAAQKELTLLRVAISDRFMPNAAAMIFQHMERGEAPGAYGMCGPPPVIMAPPEQPMRQSLPPVPGTPRRGADIIEIDARRMPAGETASVPIVDGQNQPVAAPGQIVAQAYTDPCIVPPGAPPIPNERCGGSIGGGGYGHGFCINGHDYFQYYAKPDGGLDPSVCSHGLPGIHRGYSVERNRRCEEAIMNMGRVLARLERLRTSERRALARAEAREEELDRLEFGDDDDFESEGGFRCTTGMCPPGGGIGRLGIRLNLVMGRFPQRQMFRPYPIGSPLNYVGHHPGMMGVNNGIYSGLQSNFGQGSYGCNDMFNPLAHNPHMYGPPPGRGRGRGRPWYSNLNGRGPWGFPRNPNSRPVFAVGPAQGGAFGGRPVLGPVGPALGGGLGGIGGGFPLGGGVGGVGGVPPLYTPGGVGGVQGVNYLGGSINPLLQAPLGGGFNQVPPRIDLNSRIKPLAPY